MSEMDDIKRRVEKNEKAIESFTEEQHKNSLVLKDIQSSVADVVLSIKGDKAAGVKGLVADMKDFKRDFTVEIIKDVNYLTERLKWTENRLELLELTDKKSAKHTGFIAGFAAVIGAVVSYFIAAFK